MAIIKIEVNKTALTFHGSNMFEFQYCAKQRLPVI